MGSSELRDIFRKISNNDKVSEVAVKIGIDEVSLYGIIEALQLEGYNISLYNKDDDVYIYKKIVYRKSKNIKENYISVIRVGKCTVLRILNTERNKLSFVLMRPDSDLFTYDEEGTGEEMKKVVNNIENAYGIAVDSYEDYTQEGFIELINESDSFEC